MHVEESLQLGPAEEAPGRGRLGGNWCRWEVVYHGEARDLKIPEALRFTGETALDNQRESQDHLKYETQQKIKDFLSERIIIIKGTLDLVHVPW